MGAVRLALALIVATGHVPVAYTSVGPMAAVHAFFVLSGVYMAAVYETKYSRIESGQRLFYFNRILRLWPTYIAVLALTFAAYLILSDVIRDHRALFTLFTGTDLPSFPYMLPSAIFLVGQDILSLGAGNHSMLPVRQSWTIATELLFYAIVPFVYGRKLTLWLALPIFCACIGLKAILYAKAGWQWSYFFPLSNMGYFFLGMLCYHVGQVVTLKALRRRLRLDILGPMAIIVLLLSIPNLSFETWPLQHTAFILAFAALTVLSFSDNASRIDWYLGNISYGVYLNHFLLIAILRNTTSLTDWPLGCVVVASSIALSAVTERLLQNPIDQFRKRITPDTGSARPAYAIS